jgi:hypothetical protein
MAEKTQDLSSILAASVETQNATVNDFITVPETPSTDDLSDDFDEAEEVETETEKDPENEIPLSKAEIKKAAKRWIGLFDKMQKPFLVNAYEKAILKPGDEQLLKSHQKNVDLTGPKKIKDAISENDDLYYVLKRYDEYIDACKNIPFSEEEKEMIAEPLAELVEKYKKMHLSPEMALVAAVVMVMLPRVEPLFPQFFKGIKL